MKIPDNYTPTGPGIIDTPDEYRAHQERVRRIMAEPGYDARRAEWESQGRPGMNENWGRALSIQPDERTWLQALVEYLKNRGGGRVQ